MMTTRTKTTKRTKRTRTGTKNRRSSESPRNSCRERPRCRRAADERDQLAAPHSTSRVVPVAVGRVSSAELWGRAAPGSVGKLSAGRLERTTRIGECPMIRSTLAVAAASIAASVSFSQPILAQEETDQRLGTVHFETSCNEVAQRRFDRAMRYQHSFWYRESRELFEEVLKADPNCGIAYWGIALSLLNNPHAPPPGGNLPLGLAAI